MLVDGFFPREFRIGHETRERTIYKAAHHYNIYTAQSEFPGAQHFENGTLLWSWSQSFGWTSWGHVFGCLTDYNRTPDSRLLPWVTKGGKISHMLSDLSVRIFHLLSLCSLHQHFSSGHSFLTSRYFLWRTWLSRPNNGNLGCIDAVGQQSSTSGSNIVAQKPWARKCWLLQEDFDMSLLRGQRSSCRYCDNNRQYCALLHRYFQSSRRLVLDEWWKKLPPAHWCQVRTSISLVCTFYLRFNDLYGPNGDRYVALYEGDV